MSDVDEVKYRIDLIELVQGYVRLKKSGQNYFGLCPFHTEKTPSFSVSSERQIYKCFGCDKGGDAISFVQEIEHLTFPEALRLLADRVGIRLSTQQGAQWSAQADTKTELYRTLELATKLFQKLLLEHPSGKTALQYLKKRGLTEETIREFRLGWYPLQLNITEVLKKHSVTSSMMRKAGGLERFRERITFPLFDQLGVVIGVTGRVLNDSQPKYLNSSDSPIFQKHRVLYGLHKAKKAIRDGGHAIIVEGQMDVITSHQFGYHQTIATSGTALSSDHLRIIYRLAPEIRLAFDSDTAGQRALHQAARLALEQEFVVKVIPIPSGKDAADALSANAEEWEKAVQGAPLFLDHLFDETFAAQAAVLGAEEKRTVTRALIPWIKQIMDPVERDHYREQLARRLGISSTVIEEALRRGTQTSAPAQVAQRAPTRLSLEQQFIGLLVAHPLLISRTVTQVNWQDFEEELPRTIFKTLQKGYTFKQENISEALTKDLGKIQAAEVLAWGLHHEGKGESAQEELLGYMSRLKSRKTEDVKRDFASQIEAAEKRGDRSQVKQLVEKLTHELKV